MKRIFFAIVFVLTLFVLPANSVNASESDVLREIKNLREDTNGEFKTLRDDMKTARIDTMREIQNLREDMNNHFNLLMWFIGIWIPLSMGIVGYILQRLNRHDDRFYEIAKKSLDADDIIAAIKKADPETRKRLKEVLKN